MDLQNDKRGKFQKGKCDKPIHSLDVVPITEIKIRVHTTWVPGLVEIWIRTNPQSDEDPPLKTPLRISSDETTSGLTLLRAGPAFSWTMHV